MVSPETVIFFVRASIKLGIAANSSIQQGLRDGPVKLPSVVAPSMTLIDVVEMFFSRPNNFAIIEADPSLSEHWDTSLTPGQIKSSEESQRAIVGAYFDAVGPATIWTQDDDFLALKYDPVAPKLVNQWAEDQGPGSPWLRIGYAVLDVALDYVGTNAQLISPGGKGDKLIRALILNVQSMLPNVDSEEWQTNRRKYAFAERAMSVFLRAGLKTLESEVDDLIDEAHLQELAKNMLNPLVEAFAGDDAQPGSSALRGPQLVRLRDTLLGPVTRAALSTVAENPKAFLGKRFDTEKAVGALTQGFLRQAADPRFEEKFREDGLVNLYRTALDVVVKRPEIFLKGDETAIKLGQQMIAELGGVLLRDEGKFQDGLIEDLAAASLRTFAEHGTALLPLDENKPWHKVAIDSTNSVLNGLAAGLEQDGAEAAFRRVFSREQATEFGRIVLEQAAKTPTMLTGGKENPELENILAGVARAMAKDEHLLLSGDDWLEIVAVATQLAARNPGKLFKIDVTGPEGQLAEQLISTLLKAASADFKGRADGTLLFGETLRETIRTTLLAALGNVERAAARQGAIETLVKKIDAAAKVNRHRIGADEWLFLYRHLLLEVIDGEDASLDEITAVSMLAMLEEAA